MMKKVFWSCAAFLGLSSSAFSLPVLQVSLGNPSSGLAHYANFNNLPLGSVGGSSGGIQVSFQPDGQTVTGAASGRYAAPYLSNQNGTPFGDSSTGPDTTPYLTTGIGSVIMQLPGHETFFGLLWGSVDLYNTLSFYSGSSMVASLTGADVIPTANGDQGANGTYYVNINSQLAFNRVVATSSQYAFEFDNVAYGSPVPEPDLTSWLGNL